jgi:hypothetical protein
MSKTKAKKKATSRKAAGSKKKAPAAKRGGTKGRTTVTKRARSAKNGKPSRTKARPKPRPAPNPTIKATGMTEQISEKIRYVRGLRGEAKRVDVLSGILLEVLDRFHMKDLSQVVIEELGKTNHPRAIETLSFAWNNCQNPETRGHMVRALASFPHKEVLRPLERIALSPGVNTSLRVQAVEALGRHRTNASWTTLGHVLREAALSGDRTLQGAAIEALRRADGKAVPSLLRALESEDENEQVSAATALGVTGDKSALATLKALSGSTKNAALRDAATKSAILIYCS